MTPSLNRLDLNLLRVFHAVMEERNVLRASQRICLSQSAVSHALARLRDMLDDELFIRTKTGMQPTGRAMTMAPLLREAWKSLEAAIGSPKFEPRTAERRFTIAVSDFQTVVLMPHLLALLRSEAPLVNLVIQSDSRIDLTEQIDLGQVDAAIGTFANVPDRFRLSSLFEYDDVLISHSSRQLPALSLEELAGLPIAVVTLHGEHERSVDGFVSERGLSRRSDMFDRLALQKALVGSEQSPRIAVSLPHFLALPSLLENTDLTAIVPRPLAASLADKHQLVMRELPYETDSMNVSVLWHERNAANAPQKWLRDMLKRATEPLRISAARIGQQHDRSRKKNSRMMN